MWFYGTIKQLIYETKNVIKYYDVNKKQGHIREPSRFLGY